MKLRRAPNRRVMVAPGKRQRGSRRRLRCSSPRPPRTTSRGQRASMGAGVRSRSGPGPMRPRGQGLVPGQHPTHRTLLWASAMSYRLSTGARSCRADRVDPSPGCHG
jgi:hypothetical protein